MDANAERDHPGPPAYALVCLLIQPLSIIIELIAMGFVRAPYSLLSNTISDLAAVTCTTVEYPNGPVEVCSPAGLIVNVVWVITGFALAVAAIGLRSVLRERASKVGTQAMIVLMISGLSTAATGLVPLDVDLLLHGIVSLPAIILAGAAVALMAVALAHRIGGKGVGVALGVLAALSGVTIMATLDVFGYVGIVERIAVWVPVLYFAWAGARLWATRTQARELGAHRGDI